MSASKPISDGRVFIGVLGNLPKEQQVTQLLKLFPRLEEQGYDITDPQFEKTLSVQTQVGIHDLKDIIDYYYLRMERSDMMPTDKTVDFYKTQIADLQRMMNELKTEMKEDRKELLEKLDEERRTTAELRVKVGSAQNVDDIKAQFNDARARIKELESKLEAQKDKYEEKVEKLKEKQLQLAINESKLLSRVESTKPDKYSEDITRRIMDEGMKKLSGDGENQSDAVQVTKVVMSQLPNVLQQGGEFVSAMRKENPYEPDKRVQGKTQVKQQAPPQRRNPVAARPVSNLEATHIPKEPNNRPRVDVETINPLGKAYLRWYPQTPKQLVKIVSDYILSTYAAADTLSKRELIINTFLVITNLKSIGIHIQDMLNKKVVSLINRPLEPKDAAEILWKERPDLAIKLSHMDYEQLMGYTQSIRDLPEYKNTIQFYTRPEVAEIVEKILDEVRAYQRAMEKSPKPTKLPENAPPDAVTAKLKDLDDFHDMGELQ